LSLTFLKDAARALKKKVVVLYLAYSHPRTPFVAKFVTGLVVGYALSPIDLIPDFIPVIGFLDDLIIVPAGIYLALRLIPPEIIAECETRSEGEGVSRAALPACLAAGAAVAFFWIAVFYCALVYFAK